MNILDKMIGLLEEENILPVTKQTWNSFKLIHRFPDHQDEKKMQFDYIREQVGEKCGIYIYMRDEVCLYIGKAKPLLKRIKDHYIESFKPIPENCPFEKSRWDRFFQEYNGEVEVFWKEFETEEERRLIERLLTQHLKPIFLQYN